MRGKTKLTIDVLLMIGTFFSMGFHLFGMGIHKMVGMVIFLLLILHQILNRNWYKALFRGRYSPLRMAHTVTNFLTLFTMIGIVVSGGMLAKGVEADLGDAMTTGRILHNVCSYGACIGIAAHIGFHLKGRTHHDD